MQNKILEYYNHYDEKGRLGNRHSLERIRTQQIISRYLLKKGKLRILDIGGANGIYSFWLASQGHKVDLMDLVPKHIEQAKNHERESRIKLASMSTGNACDLAYEDNSYDMVLLMGPLYHLQEKEKRIQALSEAKRVVKSKGIIFIAAISRYASLIDGFKRDLIKDDKFKTIINDDLKNGKHINDTNEEKYFTTAFFHHPDELKEEIKKSELIYEKTIAVEGFACCIENIETKLQDNNYKKYLFECLEKTEEEEALLGMSLHLLGVATKE